ncbi:MAG: hypothetical protein QOK37_4070 [Thermoanaerobaculia bacterium]|jgi:hypothetical protein|nr:hypothetical protein [Thermoanaerobaculia bacterium]
MKRTLLFVITVLLLAPAVFAETFRCESKDNRRHECSFDSQGRVEILRQVSISDCIEGSTWGREGRHRVWVSDGCRADFVVRRDRDDDRGDRRDRRGRLITCESDYDSRHRCTVDTEGGVRLSRQLSRTNCVLNRTWGYDSRGIWVKNGCRAEFWVGR